MKYREFIRIFFALIFTFIILTLLQLNENPVLKKNHLLSVPGSSMKAPASLGVALERDHVGYFKAYYMDTIAMAVDRTRYPEVEGYEDLLKTGQTLYFPHYRSKTGAFAYVSYRDAMDKQFSAPKDIDPLHRLYEEDRIRYYDDITDIKTRPALVVGIDYELRQLKDIYPFLDIIIPKEGSLSMPVGLLSKYPLTPADAPADTKDHRQLSGSYYSTDYPTSAEYNRSAIVSDFNKFNVAFFNARFDYEREVMNFYRLTPTNGSWRVIFLLFTVFLIILLSDYIYTHVGNDEVKRQLIIICILMLFWILIRFYKAVNYMPNNNILWYAYYIPYLLILLMINRMGFTVANVPVTKVRMIVVNIITWILILLVLTNDLHELVFRFHGEEGDYYYHWGAFLVFGYLGFLFLESFFIVLIRSFRVRDIGRIVINTVLFASWVFFSWAAAAGWWFGQNVDITLLMILTLICFIAVNMKMGVIESNYNYSRVFRRLEIETYLTNDNRTEFLSNSERFRPSEQLLDWAFVNASSHGTFRDSRYQYESYPIDGGVAIIRNDISLPIELHRTLESNYDELKYNHALLMARETLERDAFRMQSKTRVLNSMEETVFHHLEEISAIVKSIPAHVAGHEKEIRTKLLQSYLLLGYCKRLGNFILKYIDEDSASMRELNLLISEFSCELSVMGITAESFLDQPKDLKKSAVIELMNNYYTLISELVMHYPIREVGTRIQGNVDGRAMVSVVLDHVGEKEILPIVNQFDRQYWSVSYTELMDSIFLRFMEKETP